MKIILFIIQIFFPGQHQKRVIIQTKWTQEHKDVLTNYFKEHIKNKHAPKKQEVTDFKNKHNNFFETNNWIIKAYVYNCYK